MDLLIDPPAISAAHPTAEEPVYTSHADNSTPPPYTSNNHNHPPYNEMIMAAITALKERNGSSRQAIAKYIEKNYSSLPLDHSTLLTHHLNGLTNTGHLLMVDHSYKLPRSVPLSSTTVTAIGGSGNGSFESKRGRGRPPKLKVDAQPDDVILEPELVLVSRDLTDGLALVAKRGRGRPPSTKTGFLGAETSGFVGMQGLGRHPRPESFPVSIDHQSSLGGIESGAPVAFKRSRGRPPSTKTALAGAEMGGFVGIKRGRGRPPVPKSFPVSIDHKSSLVGTESLTSVVFKRSRGRPPKSSSFMGQSGLKRRSPLPPITALIDPRPRGRPRKDVSAIKLPDRHSGPNNMVGGVSDGGGLLPVKLKGRPPRVSGVMKARKLTGRPLGRPRKVKLQGMPPRVSGRTGRPLGRPRKNASTISAAQTPTRQQLVAHEDLKGKLEFFKSRIKQTVSSVKLLLNPETAVSAFTALQELEELVTMDLGSVEI